MALLVVLPNSLNIYFVNKRHMFLMFTISRPRWKIYAPGPAFWCTDSLFVVFLIVALSQVYMYDCEQLGLFDKLQTAVMHGELLYMYCLLFLCCLSDGSGLPWTWGMGGWWVWSLLSVGVPCLLYTMFTLSWSFMKNSSVKFAVCETGRDMNAKMWKVCHSQCMAFSV